MSADGKLIEFTASPLTDAQRMKALMDAVAALSTLEGQSSIIRLQRKTAMSEGNYALSDALAERETVAVEEEVTAMYVVVAQVKILSGTGILERCCDHLNGEVAGQI